MKISREARTQARRLFQKCQRDGELQPGAASKAVSLLLALKPRHYLQIAERFRQLVQFEVRRRTFTVESALELPDRGESIFKSLESRFGQPLACDYRVNPKLVGGLRIQVGSHVFDGSIRQRLRLLNPTLN